MVTSAHKQDIDNRTSINHFIPFAKSLLIYSNPNAVKSIEIRCSFAASIDFFRYLRLSTRLQVNSHQTPGKKIAFNRQMEYRKKSRACHQLMTRPNKTTYTIYKNMTTNSDRKCAEISAIKVTLLYSAWYTF